MIIFRKASDLTQIRNFCSNSKMMKCITSNPLLKENQLKGLKVSEVPIPEYDKKREVLIKVEACGVNRSDLFYVMDGAGSFGLEVSGFIVDPYTGKTTDRKVMALLPGGGFAQYAKVNKDHVMDIPNGLDFVQAASIPN